MTDPAVTGLPVPLSDRRLALLGRDAAFNGVDYAEVGDQRLPGRQQIRVHFINRVRVRGTLAADRPPVTLAVSGSAAAPVLAPIDEDTAWSTDTSGRPVLHLHADLPDAPARYLLTVHSDRVDPYLAAVAFTIEGRGDPVDRDPAALGTVAPGTADHGTADHGPTVPIDYLAKDFTSFLGALSNFSAARYPLWAERSEADFGVMLLEALSALADELSYLQDRVAAEASVGTATQRLSLVRHARLVDYEPLPALAATTVLQFDVAARAAALPDVIQVQALGGQAGTVDFAAGPWAAGPGAWQAPDARWNRYDETGQVAQLVPYQWDRSTTWLRQGATSIWIDGHGHGFYPGQELLIDTATPGGDSPNREVIQVTGAEERTDPVQERPVTLIRLADGLASDHDLTRTELAGNLLPAVHGRVTDELFAIPGDPQPSTVPLATVPLATVPLATVRGDHGGRPAHCLHPLAKPLAWRAVPAPEAGGRPRPRPALELREVPPTTLPTNGQPNGQRANREQANRTQDSREQDSREQDSRTQANREQDNRTQANSEQANRTQANREQDSGEHVNGQPNGQPANDAGPTWQWFRRLIDAAMTDRAFTVTPERYSQVAGPDDLAFADYDGDGATVRFGDGTFGRPPVPGTVFQARYLAGGGLAGNVAADTIVAVTPGDPANGLVLRCTNPFPATGGADPETHDQIRDRAPRQPAAGLLSLTSAADYQAAAQLFTQPRPLGTHGSDSTDGAPWARQAVAAARWTGSWFSTATVVDPVATEPSAAQRAALAALASLLAARRLAGADTSLAVARYRWIDLRITCETLFGHRPGEVAATVLARLTPRRGASGATGFFGRDRWTFGQPLPASALVAAVQSCPGLAGVTRAEYRPADSPGEWRPLPATLAVADGEILRIDNDQDQPGHGLIFITAAAPR